MEDFNSNLDHHLIGVISNLDILGVGDKRPITEQPFKALALVLISYKSNLSNDIKVVFDFLIIIPGNPMQKELCNSFRKLLEFKGHVRNHLSKLLSLYPFLKCHFNKIAFQDEIEMLILQRVSLGLSSHFFDIPSYQSCGFIWPLFLITCIPMLALKSHGGGKTEPREEANQRNNILEVRQLL